jgi:hypothetical protein
MNKVLGFFGILTLATLTISGRNPKWQEPGHLSLMAGESAVAPLYIMLPRVPEKLKIRSTLPITGFRSSAALATERGSSVASKEPGTTPVWLAELNQWRRMAGLHVVAENAHLSYGSEQHARYLVVQGPADTGGFRAYDRSIGPGAHFEQSHSPFYTAAGAEAAIGGPLAPDVIQGADVAWEGRTELGDIDNLILAPFHRLSLLAPWARIGGYGSFGDYPRRAAALALRGPLMRQQHGQPIEFPPANSNIVINALSGSEWPNPIASCAGYERPVGLPITLQLGRRIVLQSYSVRDQTSGAALDACGFDGASYRNPDATQQRRGRELLNAYGAVVLIPHKPLSAGHQYQVMIQTSRASFEWAFRLRDAAGVATAQARRSEIRQVAASR